MEYTLLTKIGLTKAEAQIYVAMLPMEKVTVTEIAKATGFHRTNIYDVLDQLVEKGFVSFFNEGKKTYYKAAEPECIYDFIKHMEADADSILPELKKVKTERKEKIDIQIYKGRKGMKVAMMSMARIASIVYGFGLTGQLRKYMPELLPIFKKEMERRKVKYKAIYNEFYPNPLQNSEIKYVPKDFGNPVATFMYNNTVFINIWHPDMAAIIIKSKDVYESYIRSFNLLWKIAREKPYKN